MASAQPHLYALVSYEDDYVQPLILSALESLLPQGSYTLLAPPPTAEISLASLLPHPQTDKVLQISPYESIDFDFAAGRAPGTALVNSYVIRKALIRKHFLSATVDNWVAKHPDSVLSTHVKRSEGFEVDFAEFLDDALVEAWDLRASLERNDGRLGSDGEQGPGLEWWILKPSMSDRGQGIRLFCTVEQLQGIFDEWEEGLPDEDGDEVGGGAADGATARNKDEDGDDHILASHLRHFVAQPYIDPPLLLPEMGNRKFHIRVYVLAVGSLRVYVFRDMLALFAAKPYEAPRASSGGEEGRGEMDLDAHLTNTCLQGDDVAAKAGSVRRFWELPLPRGMGESVFKQICAVTGDVFEAAARGMMVHFQPLECAFDVYGLDFLVDASGTAWLLEVNAFPDFKQTGDLRDLVGGFWESTLRLTVVPMVGGHATAGDDMVLVSHIDLGRRS